MARSRYVVGPIRLCGNLRIEPDQRLRNVVLDENLVRLPWQMLRAEVVPTEAARSVVRPAGAMSSDPGIDVARR